MADVELTASQTRELQALDQTIQELQTLLTRAERAGIDVSGLQARVAAANDRRVGMLREFTAASSARRQR